MIKLEIDFASQPEFVYAGPGGRCLVACADMAFRSHDTVLPEWEIEQAVGYVEGFNTQNSQAAVALADYIGGIRLYSRVDFARFASEGGNYLRNHYPPKWYAAQKMASSPEFARERESARQVVVREIVTHAPGLQELDFEAMLEDYYLIMSVDAAKIWNCPGVLPHSIFAYMTARAGKTNYIVFHDPAWCDGFSMGEKNPTLKRALRQHIIAVPKS